MFGLSQDCDAVKVSCSLRMRETTCMDLLQKRKNKLFDNMKYKVQASNM